MGVRSAWTALFYDDAVPIEPPPSHWAFPPLDDAEPEGPVAVGGDLEPGTLLCAYRSGLFPMPVGRQNQLGWWSPDPRAVIPVDQLYRSRSLVRSMRGFHFSTNQAFDEVVLGCADPGRPYGWINDDIREAYHQLHELGWAHSVEVWSGRELVGGVYGVGIGSFFAGESMFHRATDASKAALVHLVDRLRQSPSALFDVQWLTPHLESLGAVEIPRTQYLRRLRAATSGNFGRSWESPA